MVNHHAQEPDGIARPRVIVSVVATVDGRVALNRAERLLDAGPSSRWRTAWPPDVDDLLARCKAAIDESHQPTVVLEGSGTFVADDAGTLELPHPGEPAEELWTDFLPHRSQKWFAVVDGRGRMAWSFRQNGETMLVVIVSRSTPLAYLSYLRREQIPYLVVGGDVRVDLSAALVRIRTQLGAECVLSEAGGGLNGALLRAGLIDELHVITVPGLVGGIGTPSIVDGPALEAGSLPTRLRTVDVKVGSHGSIWAHYEVIDESRSVEQGHSDA